MHELLKQTITALRALALWLLGVSVLGYLWFFGEHGLMTSGYFAAATLALAAFAFMPRCLLPRAPWRQVVPGLSIAAILLTAHQLHGDLTQAGGADATAARLRLLECVVFIAMFLEARHLARGARSA